MKGILVIIVFFIVASPLFGQQAAIKIAANAPTPLEFREVSGVVLDSINAPIVGATVKLKAGKDSMVTTTDNDGIFVLEKIRAATFVVTVSAVGYTTIVRRYLKNDLAAKLVLEPIIMHDKAYQLKQVTIKGTPSIVYKIDTVEYKASDYRVPPNARVDELLRKMEGMEVGRDGSLTHQGEAVKKVKLNGKEFGGGNVAETIQNLPAAIVDKIQVVDDYGDQAARTGIKTGDPTKTLNITTRADKSIGIIAYITSQEGNNDRYKEALSVQNLNANKTISLIGDIQSTVNGVASTTATAAPVNVSAGNPAASQGSSLPGTTTKGTPTFSYTNTWANNLTITGSYAYGFNNTNSVSNSYGQINSSIGPSDFKNYNTAKNTTRSQELKLKVAFSFNKTNYIQINPFYDQKTSGIDVTALTNNLNYFTTGFEHPVVNLITSNPTTGYDYGLTALFVHSFNKPKRNFSVQVGFTQTNSQVNGDKNTDYRYYMDTTQNILVRDSLSHLLTFKTSNSQIYLATITYTEPLNNKARLDFIGDVRSSVYDNKATSDTVLANGSRQELARLENIYNFSFTETKITAQYLYENKKTTFVVGAAIVPTVLSGTQIDNNDNTSIQTSRSDFRVVPVFQYSYSWSKVEQFRIYYTGANKEPNFQQIQPFIDRSDPNNIIIGNPNLRPTFTHSVTARYNKYFPNNKFNLSFNLTGKLIDDQVTTNVVQVTIPLTNTLNKTINEINYVNVNGDETVRGSYSISQQLNDRRYNLTLNGNVTYNFTNAMSDNLLYHTTIWDFNERFGPTVTLNDNNFTINPFVGYDIYKSLSGTLNGAGSDVRTVKLAIDGQMYFFNNNFQLHYDASKNYISGFANYSLNPLVINASFEKRLLKSHTLLLTFDVFDILHQNTFIQQSVTPQSTTYTLSSSLSRYFLVGLKLNFQKWGGTPMKNGQPMKRRGDGSFIN